MIQLLVAWGPAAFWAGVLFFLSAQQDVPGGFTLPAGADKVVHFALYFVLGGALAWGRTRTRALRRRMWTTDGVLIAGGMLYAASDEWHQSFVPGRHPSGGDVVADSLGLLAGYLVIRHLAGLAGADAEPSAPSH